MTPPDLWTDPIRYDRERSDAEEAAWLRAIAAKDVRRLRLSRVRRWADFTKAALTLAAWTALALFLLAALIWAMRSALNQREPIATTCSPNADPASVRTCEP